MTDKPILFSGEMIRAILDGSKTQTRRVIKLRDGTLPQDEEMPSEYRDGIPVNYVMGFSKSYPYWQERRCPYGDTGDHLWVRETWQAQNNHGQWWHEVPKEGRELHNWSIIDHATNKAHNPPKWIPSIFMPRWASRITLEVTAVRVERLREINEEDAVFEGIEAKEPNHVVSARYRFAQLWDSINAKRGYEWEINPLVWVVDFKMVQ